MLTRERTPASSALPATAPLPSLTAAFSRRRAVFGAVALAAAPVAALPALASSEAVDPIVDMYRRAKALRAVHDHPDTSIEDAEAAYDGVSDLRAEAFELGATTPAGALAALQWARDEFGEYYVETGTTEPDWLDLFTLKLLDSAIAVLRTEVGNV